LDSIQDNVQDIKPRIYGRDEHPISRSQIDPDALKIMYRLIRHGYKAYLVGGGVRDLLLRGRPKDFDIATDATPRRVKEIFGNSRIIGRRFKLVHVFFRGGKIIEVSTFRDISDPIEPDENAPEGEAPLSIAHDNKYGTEVTDAFRRDLTINALFYDLSTFSIIDYVGGVRDLGEGIVRIIGEPDVRILEDPVRMLRVVRHAARNGFIIEESALQSIAKHKALILQCPQMRVYEELKKDLKSGHALSVLRLLARTDLLPYLLPELSGERAALLADDGALARGLARGDELVRDGTDVSVTASLALIALFSYTPAEKSDEEPILQFAGGDEILEHVRTCFSKLAVPRKERERIGEVLMTFNRLARMPLHNIKAGNLAKRGCLEDLIQLLDLLNTGGVQDELLHVLRHALEIRGGGGDDRDDFERPRFPDGGAPGRGRRRRRRGGRGRRGPPPHASGDQ
jgi:poly(A) polymerase